MVGVDQQGCARGAMKLLALSIGTLILGLVPEPCSLKESLPLLKVVNAVAVELISTGVRVNLGKVHLTHYKNSEHMSEEQHFFNQCTDRPVPHHITIYAICTVGQP